MRAWLQKHGLSLVLIAVLLVMMAVTAIMAPSMFAAEGVQGVSVWKWWVFITVLSLEADAFGAILLVILTKRLRESGSAESSNVKPEEDE
jgi:hypothetical protein